jgi:hypothetical protein
MNIEIIKTNEQTIRNILRHHPKDFADSVVDFHLKNKQYYIHQHGMHANLDDCIYIIAFLSKKEFYKHTAEKKIEEIFGYHLYVHGGLFYTALLLTGKIHNKINQ